ncbi:MAG: arsenate reductase [Cyclobacteriaceae bacterium]|jgi:arsenate reductase
MVTIYHNPRCMKSRETLSLLEAKGEKITIVEYLKEPPTKEELKKIIKMLGINAADLIRKGEPDFKDHFKGKEMTDEEWIEAMLQFPKLMERPIVINGEKAAIGRPPQQVLTIL